MKLIVGLGNPGKEYEKTRHNIGFGVVDFFYKYHFNDSHWQLNKKANAAILSSSINNRSVMLCKPQTFMNLSGQAVAYLIDYYEIVLSDLIVVHDDLDLPFGEIRAKTGGGTAGHRGLNSLVQHLKSKDFSRIRVGIGRPLINGAADKDELVSSYVLSTFFPAEAVIMPEIMQRTVDYLSAFIANELKETLAS